MDRFEWADGSLQLGEALVESQSGVGLYNGNEKTPFEYGVLTLTTHRLLWRDNKNRSCVLALPLSCVVFLEEQPSGFAKSAKIVCHLTAAPSDKNPGPVSYSPHSFIRLSFREAGEREFFKRFQEQLQAKKWEQKLPQPAVSAVGASKIRHGIVGIERAMQQKHKSTHQNISQAFEDLNNLMEKAKEMVSLSKTISTKIKEKQGSISEDETIQFKSYLLSMGIADPVTRQTHGTGDKYFVGLARQLCSMLEKPIQENGGMMTLTDAFCRVNRARGMELLSPKDLLQAAEMMEVLGLPVRLKRFDSGVMVLHSGSENEEEIISKTTAVVEERKSVTAEELAQILGISIVLAQQRLLLTERVGGACRDESVEGLRFHVNEFLKQPAIAP